MKKKASILLLIMAGFLVSCLISCDKGPAQGGSAAGITIDKDTSYAVGMYLAEQFALPTSIHYDYKSFMEGFRDFTEQQETRLSREEGMAKIEAFSMMLSAEIGKQASEEETAFLAENGQKSGVVTTASGLQYEVISEGNGPKPGPNDTVTVNYEGKLLNGTVFDSSYERGEPAAFNLGNLIPGWKEGIQLMSTGSTYNFYIPSALGYGPGGAGGGAIPPNAVLVFKVELISIEG